MPYKIYTYVDPYRISKTDFWDGPIDHIKNYPQLCASRTLVNGLINVMQDDIVSLICPLDDIVNKRLFKTWAEDIGMRILQYSKLSSLYRAWNQKKKISDDLYVALSHNKDEMLDSLRLFIELGINSSVLNTDGLNMEHRLFVYLLKILENESLFKFPEMPNIGEIIRVFKQQAEAEKEEKKEMRNKLTEISDEKLWEKEEKLLNRMIENIQHWDGKHVVIHGIHQFTPLQLRFITHLDKLGAEVIFLHNYLPEYKEIYSSWSYVYQQFNAPVYHDKNIKMYAPIGQFQKPGNAIASNLGLICEDSISRTDKRIQNNYELYKNVKAQPFDNISEYAGYISDEFMEAEISLDDTEKQHNKNEGTAAVLRRMKEVVYTANKDVDDLLQVYHPEYARNRHFLNYPIGQFFMALYAMWDLDMQCVMLDYNSLRECVNSGMLTKYNAETLLKTLMNLQPLFEHVESMEEFNKTIGKDYKNAYRQVITAKQGSLAFSLKTMNIYNTYKITEKDFDDLYKAICEIDKIAKRLFAETANEKFSFKKHFERLGEFVKEKQSRLVNEEEERLINQLMVKLNSIQMSEIEDEGTFEDLKNGLYFFLKQKDKPVADWFVKNFEQIEGDVLNSKSQNKLGYQKTYHFACVSDIDMNKDIDELLPWPLSKMFIEKAYNPKELSFQVYYAALGEKSNFLRYALFYGLYFNQCDSKISFVKNYGDNTTNLYVLLKLIGIKEVDDSEEKKVGDCRIASVVKSKPVDSMEFVREQMADVFLCPYRYLLDYVLNPQPIISGTFLFQKLYENLLIDETWKILKNKKLDDVRKMISEQLKGKSKILKSYFPFFRETEILDIERRAENYIFFKVLQEDCKEIPPYKSIHMLLRRNFGNALFVEDGQDYPEQHPLDVFDSLTRWEEEKRIYSLYEILKGDGKKMIEATLKYINDEEENMARVGSWCAFCPSKGICLKSFAMAN